MANLKRTLGLGALVVYAVGDILGAGIYALVGKVAGVAGHLTWVSFCVALGVAFVTALSYAELAARFPKSGGASHFCQKAFDREWFSQWVGWLVLWSGVISLATATVAFCGYFHAIGPAVPKPILVVGFLSLLGFVNFRGMQESSAMNFVCTAVELSGLLVVITLGASYVFGSAGATAALPSVGAGSVFAGAALAFFAFVGFEDLVNVAEEAKNPQRDLPRACVGGLLLAGLVYVAISWIAPQVVAPLQLSQSNSPLLTVVTTAHPGFPSMLFGAVAIFAVANTALLNFVMASRLLFGMSKDGLLPAKLSLLHSKRQTPVVAIGCVYVVVVILALVGPLAFLAATTSCLILTVFLIVHVALWRVHKKHPRSEHFRVPSWIPYLGVVVTVGLLFFIPWREKLSALALLAVSYVIVYFGTRLRRA